MSWTYPGFASPTYTQIPDEFFDQVMCHLTDAELRVLLYIMRRTFGFKKPADAISYNQFLKGIKTRDGRQLDEGCGLAAPTNLSRALRGLEEKGLIAARRGKSAKGDKATTVYALRFRAEGVLSQQEYPGPGVLIAQEYPPRPVLIGREYPTDPRSEPVLILDQQQETATQETGSNSTETLTAPSALDITIDKVSVALGESRKRKANRTRAGALAAGLSTEYAAQLAERALIRVKVQQEQGTIEAPMAYYFSVLAELVKQAQDATTKPKGRRSGLAGPYSHVVRS